MSLAPRIHVFFLLFLLVCSFLIRLIGWDDPYFGFNIARQITSLNSIDAYARDGVDFLKLSAYWTLDGWGHVRLQELPIYQALSAWVSGYTQTTLSAARIVNLFFALLTLPVVFQIAAIHFCRKTAIYSVLFFAFAPLNLMYQSALLIDISTVFFASLAYYILAKYFQGTQNKTLFFIFLLAGLYCVLVKPLYFLPSGVLLATHFFQQWRYPRMKGLLNYTVRHRAVIGLFALITLSMFLWVGVQSQVNSHATTEISRLSTSMSSLDYLHLPGHLFEALFYARILFRGVLVVLNPITFLFFIFGLLLLFRDHRGSVGVALIYSIIWFHIIFGDVVTSHEYYELSMVPFASVIAGRGATWIEERMQSEFQFVSNYMLSAGIIFGTVICSVLIFSVNFIAALNLEHRADPIEKEMRGVLEQGKGAHVYVDRTNFPIADYVWYNRTAKLMYFTGLLSKEQIRVGFEPLRHEELMNALRQYGNAEMVISGVTPEIDIKKLQLESKGNIRYLMFYRFTEEVKAKIKNRIEGYKLTYESENWLVYDLML